MRRELGGDRRGVGYQQTSRTTAIREGDAVKNSDSVWVEQISEMNPGERWKAIPGYERTYAVSSHGRIYSRPRPKARGGLLSVSVGKRGYPGIGLSQDGIQKSHEVHRLVALAFIGPRPEGYEVRHLDGDRLNPHASNLAYGTVSENLFDRVRHGRDHNVNKTHCPQGHPYAGDNLLRVPSRPTARYCRTCNVEQKKRKPDYRDEWKVGA